MELVYRKNIQIKESKRKVLHTVSLHYTNDSRKSLQEQITM